MAKRKMTAKWRRALLKNLKKARAARRRKGGRKLTRAAKRYCPKVRKSRRPSLRAALLCLLRHKRGRYTSVHKKALRRLRGSKAGRKLLRKHKLGRKVKAGRKARRGKKRGRKAARRGRKTRRWSRKARRRAAKVRRIRARQGVKRGALKRRMGKRVRSAMAKVRRLAGKRGRKTAAQAKKMARLQKFLAKKGFRARPVAARRRRRR